MPSLNSFVGPVTQRSYPGGVLRRTPTLKVRMPLPKWLSAKGAFRRVPRLFAASSNRTSISALLEPPFHSASQATGDRISQPWAFAIERGRHLYAYEPGVRFIHSRRLRAGRMSTG